MTPPANPFEISPRTIARIEKHAKPFVDTFDGVLNRILDIYERSGEAERDDDVVTDGNIRDFDPASPPSLTHTKVLSIEFKGVKFSRADTNWNALLDESIRAARKHTKSDGDMKRLILVNTADGKKEDEGYRYLADANLSVQGQDSNAAWKATYYIAKQIGISFDVVFTWRTKEGAAYPGITGRFSYVGRMSSLKELPFSPVMFKEVTSLDLSVRATNGLKNMGIKYVGDLVKLTEAELWRTELFGRKITNELKEVLAQMNLHLGMEVPGWPPANI